MDIEIELAFEVVATELSETVAGRQVSGTVATTRQRRDNGGSTNWASSQVTMLERPIL